MPDVTERACRACGSAFQAVRKGTRGGSLPVYCSDECRRRAACERASRYYTPSSDEARECRWCFVAFVVSGRNRPRYCSAECKRLAVNHRSEHEEQDRCDLPWGECPWCGRPCVQHHRKRFCSSECQKAKSNARKRPGRTWPHVCATCGTEFRSPAVGTRHCSANCRRAAFRARKPQPTSCQVPWAECAWCGHWFVKRNCRKYCSQRCLDANHPWKARVTEIVYGDCRQCGRIFVRRVGRLGEFCSQRCGKRARKRFRAHLKRVSGWGDSFTLREIAERDGWRCHICRRKVPDREYRARKLDPTLDHLVPVSAGGAHTRENVALAHNRCNWERSVGGEVQLRLVG